jgi:hypothetical protein
MEKRLSSLVDNSPSLQPVGYCERDWGRLSHVECIIPAGPLEHACYLVGRFLYHFSRVEQKIDQAIIKLLAIDEKVAPAVTGGIDFSGRSTL